MKEYRLVMIFTDSYKRCEDEINELAKQGFVYKEIIDKGNYDVLVLMEKETDERPKSTHLPPAPKDPDSIP